MALRCCGCLRRLLCLQLSCKLPVFLGADLALTALARLPLLATAARAHTRRFVHNVVHEQERVRRA
jgi:hypothetical protein